MEFVAPWLWALAISSLLMVAVWITSVLIRNAGIVDIAWSAGFTPLAWFYWAVAPGNPERKLLITLMVSFWSLRLGSHLYRRVMGHHPVEDARYSQFREKWGPSFNSKMFGFFQIQAVLLWVLTLPFLLACLNPDPEISTLEWLGAALWALGLAGESLADRQLAAFARKPENRGKVCEDGLWYYSRHPNYFFEWTIWVAYFVFALAQPHGLWTIYCPLLMLHFLVNITGVKLAEQGSLKRRGDAYRAYQATTSAFVPWFKRKGIPA
jgi:steroid 5-alpha reductase family enzyme